MLAGDSDYRSLMPAEMVTCSRGFLAAATSWTTVNLVAALGRLPMVRWVVHWAQAFSVPGMVGHYLVRKRCLEDLVEELAESIGGLDQLVIIGAGLDSLGLRTAHKTPQRRVFELDHPATLAVKQRAFTAKFLAQPANLRLHPVDLRSTDLRATLRSLDDFSFAARTVFIAEGVFMYIDMLAVGRTLDVLFDFPEGSAAFAFTYMIPSQTDGRPAFRGQTHGVDRWLSRKQEPFVWAATPSSLDSFVRTRNLKSLGHADAAALRSRYLSSPGLETIPTATGENIAWVAR